MSSVESRRRLEGRTRVVEYDKTCGLRSSSWTTLGDGSPIWADHRSSFALSIGDGLLADVVTLGLLRQVFLITVLDRTCNMPCLAAYALNSQERMSPKRRASSSKALTDDGCHFRPPRGGRSCISSNRVAIPRSDKSGSARAILATTRIR